MKEVRMRHGSYQKGTRRKGRTAVAKKSPAHDGAPGPYRTGSQEIGYRHTDDPYGSGRAKCRPGETGNTAVQRKGHDEEHFRPDHISCQRYNHGNRATGPPDRRQHANQYHNHQNGTDRFQTA